MKKIFVPAGGCKTDLVVFETALAVARPLDAHLEFLHVHLDASQAALHTPHVEFAHAGALRNALDHLKEQCENRAWTAKNNVLAFCEHAKVDLVDTPRASTGVTGCWRLEEGEALQRLLFHARHNDLVVMGRHTQSDGLPQTRLETLLLESGRPLLLASSAVPTSLMNRVTVCWKEAADAARAVSAAMPILRKAEQVVVVSVCEADDSTAEAVGAIVRQLRWNGIGADSRVYSLNGWSTADRLAMVAHESGASLLVMGGYGHWRAREVLFGGCTQATLEMSELPVFVLH
jgi:nucleotide-binding universal stress UspA family protein